MHSFFEGNQVLQNVIFLFEVNRALQNVIYFLR